MSKHAQLVRIKKLKKDAAIIEVAAKHNLREIAAEIGGYGTIDGRRTPSNYILRGAGTSAAVAATAQALMEQAEIKRLRKDAVRGLELVISLRPNSPIDGKAFFTDALAWAESYFQQAPIISAVVHCDQTAEHCHVIILPLVGGRMNGSRLMGNKAKLQSMQADFNRQVGERYGLTYQAAYKRQSATILPPACKDVLEALKARPECLNEPEVCAALLVAISHNADAILLALEKPTASGKPIGFDASSLSRRESNPIGFADGLEAGKYRSLSCVGFANTDRQPGAIKLRKKGRAQAKAVQVLELLAAGIAKQEIANRLGMGIASVYRIAAISKQAKDQSNGRTKRNT